MNQLVANGAESFLARFRGLRDRLPGDGAVRDTAAAVFSGLGLPSRRQEAWHYTSLQSLSETSYQEPLTEVSSAPVLGAVPDLPRVVLVDGRYQPSLSSPPAGLQFGTFGEQPEFGPQGEALPMVALNTMLAEDGVQLHVPAGVDAGVVVLLTLAPDGHRPVDFHPRHRIRLEAGAKLTVVEIARGEGTYLHNAVTEVDVAADAVLAHVRLQDESLEAVHVNTTLADIAERGTYDAFVLTLGARLSRTEVHATLGGAHAEVHLNGAQLLTGTQHGDITTVVRHAAPSCSSNQTIKNVLSGRARGVFQGKIEVDRIAQKTDGYQMSQALLLSPTAEIDCKPQLEIYADDVKCSHGTTVGELDADQLFYLRSRGVPAAEARAILVRAFLTEAMANIKDDTARDVLEQAIEAWWERHPA
ncbi:MAG: Fe-S cluster assembly protein SufD [Janthinobacterium lividum]